MKAPDLSLSLRDAPAVPGLTFRTFRGAEEFPGMVAVCDACRPMHGYEWPTSVEDLARSFAHLDHCDPHQDMIFAAARGDTVGYGRGRWYLEPDGACLHELTGHVAPVWRGREIGRAILRWTEGRQRKVASEQTETGPHLFQVSTQDSEQGMTEAALGVDTENISGALRLYEPCGFRPAQSGSVYRKPFGPGD